MKAFSFKCLLSAILVTLLLSTIVLPLFAVETEYEYVKDREALLTDAERRSVNAAAEQAFNETGARIYIITVHQDYYDGEIFCREYGLSESDPIIILIVNTIETPVALDLITFGDSYSKISDKEAKRIYRRDEIRGNMNQAKYYEGALGFVKCARKAYSGHLAASTGKIITISLLLGASVAFITCFCVCAHYKKKQKSANYPLEHYTNMELTVREDVFLGSHVSRTLIDTGSSGSGSSSSGGSSHSGGRGHR